jgi:hypothetical protein
MLCQQYHRLRQPDITDKFGEAGGTVLAFAPAWLAREAKWR